MKTPHHHQAMAVILGGGVAKGAFEAGALEVLTQAHGADLAQVIGTSSGALNALLLAAAVRAGRAHDGARQLLDLWRRKGDWRNAFAVKLGHLVRGRGLSTSDGIYNLARQYVDPFATAPKRHPVRLDLVATSSRGVVRQVRGENVITYEARFCFDEAAFDTADGRERVYRAAAASAAFPIAYEPVEIPEFGPCYDGGLTNDAPISLAAAGPAHRVVAVVPYPATPPPFPDVAIGPRLLAHWIELLIHERLYRDLAAAASANAVLERLQALERRGALEADQLEDVRQAIGYRRLELVTIRPAAPLPGGPFAGLFDARLRSRYIEEGRRAAAVALENPAMPAAATAATAA